MESFIIRPSRRSRWGLAGGLGGKRKVQFFSSDLASGSNPELSLIIHLYCSYAQLLFTMTTPSDTPSDGQPVSPIRQQFLQRLVALAIKPTTHEYYVQWAEAWTIRTVQDLMGHASVETTMIYLHVMQRPGAGGPSPLDLA